MSNGELAARMRQIELEIQVQAGEALETIADEIVHEAKNEASQSWHTRNSPTPASPGSGPSMISGTLVDSITRTGVELHAEGWECKVGMEPGHVPDYPGKRRSTTPSSRYAYFLEVVGTRLGHRFPFLGPAAEKVQALIEPTFRRRFQIWR